MEKRKETTQKMEAVEKWPPECFGLYYQPHRPEKALSKTQEHK